MTAAQVNLDVGSAIQVQTLLLTEPTRPGDIFATHGKLFDAGMNRARATLCQLSVTGLSIWRESQPSEWSCLPSSTVESAGTCTRSYHRAFRLQTAALA